MKKIMGIVAVILLVMASLTYAGGGQVCGDKAAGPAGTDGSGQTSQNRAPNPD